MNLDDKKIKVRWYLCTKASEDNKLFTVDSLYPMTDNTILNPKCTKTCVHKIYTDANHWYEFSDICLDGLTDEINIFGGNILEKSKMNEEVIGNADGETISYEELW